MKRCNTCGHTNGRLRPVKSRYTGHPIPGEFICVSPRACIRRMELVGQWVGKRVLRRIEADGTEWTIRRAIPALRVDELFVLTMAYRDIRMTSRHASAFAAKAHADDLLASWKARSLADYAGGAR